MSRSRDLLAPLVAGALVLAVALGVILLLDHASDEGVSALTHAKQEQVQATADSFNARVTSELTAIAGLGHIPWQLTPGSKADQKVLDSYNVDPDAQSGFFVVNAQGTVTSGVLLRSGVLGSGFLPSRWAGVKSRLAGESSIVLPVSDNGLTTELPTYDFIVAIRGRSPTSVRGAVVFEEAVTTTSSFQTEIAQLGDRSASSAAWFFIDSRGSVVATTQDSGLGEKSEDSRYRSLPSGVSELGGRLVVAADVPSIGWRVIFRENRSQFERPLSGPLQTAGLILVLLLLVVGLVLIVILVRRLRAAREQEQRLNTLTRSQAEFISVVSHELRTPVAGILGFLQTTVDHWTTLSDSDRLSTVRRAVTNARRLQAMTRDVLDTESIEAGRFGYSFARLDLGTELQTAVDGSTDADPSHPVVLHLPGEPIVIDGDSDRLHQVLTNLLENARKNAPPGEPIVVETEIVGRTADSPDLVRVSVVDHGPGVAPESIERIFEKFVRENDNAVTGTGLGLYIARTIVEAHHGRIWCESDPGRQTTFVFELPIAARRGATAVAAGV